jgi:hypothetical protein
MMRGLLMRSRRSRRIRRSRRSSINLMRGNRS